MATSRETGLPRRTQFVTDLIPLSATQIKAWDDGEGGGCPTQWAGTYLAKFPRAESGGTNAGSKVHGHLERYLRDGTGIPSGETYVYGGKTYMVGACAAAMTKHLPPAGSVPAANVERQFSFVIIDPRNGARYRFRGGIDLYHDRIVRLNDGNEVRTCDVYDHKSTRSSQYVPSVAKLQRDVQVAMYAIVHFLERAGLEEYIFGQGNPYDDVKCQWTYGYTSDGGTTVRRFTMSRKAAEDVFLEKIFPVAEKIYAAYRDAKPWRDHERNLSACSAYGGCARLQDCAPSATQRGLKMLSREQLLAKMAARKAAPAPNDPATDVPRTGPDVPSAAPAATASRLERIRQKATEINRTPPATVAEHASVSIEIPASAAAEAAETLAATAQAPVDLVTPDAPDNTALNTGVPAVKRRGRPRKVDATVTATLTCEADIAPLREVPEEDQPVSVGVPATLPVGGYILYVDCHPIRGSVTYAHDLIRTASAMVRDDAGVPDIGLVDFGKGGPALAAQIRQNLLDTPVAGAIVTTKYTPEGKATLQVLIEMADNVVLAH